ncbi:hypothetical protein [Cylindrospermum sp. FACHB-282]|uniref:hypothetical protein n=1 Tax=Cylindrospermum sp. FACHB-282 TaxID=2692794 RepID=UPI001688F4C8|nr:hypothetical protein [Cylindrospermum sp. FACHB-282]MBD2388038.1 hypothetical protein [Cylindrospermum sp. FACHB-282]
MATVGDYPARFLKPDTAVIKKPKIHKFSTMSTLYLCDQLFADIKFNEIGSVNDIPVEEYLAQWNQDDDKKYPAFTGEEFLTTHDTIDEHPYAVAFGEFLDNGIDPDTANLLAFGENRFDLISDDLNDPLRQTAFKIFDLFAKAGYWSESGESEQ